MWPDRDPLITPAVCFAAGVFIFNRLELSGAELAVGLASFGILAYVLPRLRWVAAALAIVFAGGLAMWWHRPGPPPELDAADGEIVLLTGCIVDSPVAEGPRIRFLLEVEPEAIARVSLIVREGERIPNLAYGQRVEVETKVRTPRNFGNPGGFDYVRFLRRQHTFWTAGVRGEDRVRVLSGQCGDRVTASAYAVRGWITRQLQHLLRYDEYASRLAPALLVGDNSAVERSWTEDYRRTGTYHAIVISGLHITVVAGSALFLLRVLGLPLGWVLLSAAMLAWTYAAVAVWQSPAVRSAAGFTLFLVARWFFRRGSLLNLLAATAIVFLACDPEQLFEPSFQLTFLSVAAIGGIASPLIERSFGPYADGCRGLGRVTRDLRMAAPVAQFRIELRLLAETAAVWTRVPAAVWLRCAGATLRIVFWLAEMVTVSFAVQLCLGLVLIAYFHQLSVTSVLANIVVVPALTLAVPIALVAAATGSEWIAAPAGILIQWSRSAASWWAGLEPGWRIPDPPLLAALATAALVAALCTAAYRRWRRRWVAALGLASAGAYVCLGVYPFPAGVSRGSLELTVIDVGQGESLLLAFPEGQTMLIDGGGLPVFDPRIKPRMEIGEDVVSPYLWSRGIRRLDVVAASHLHDDHAAGLPAIIRNFRPREVWTGAVVESPLLQAIRAAARETGAVLKRPGSQRYGGADIEVLWPDGEYVAGPAPANDDSLVVAVAFGNHRFLLTGDIGPRVEQRLLEAGRLGQVDVLKIAHHGGRTSTTSALLAATRPLFGVASAGAGNSYGHPHPDVMQRLWTAGAKVLRTDTQGLVSFRTDGRRLEVRSSTSGNYLFPFAEKSSN